MPSRLFRMVLFFAMPGILSGAVFFIKLDCFLHIIKNLTTLDNNIFTEFDFGTVYKDSPRVDVRNTKSPVSVVFLQCYPTLKWDIWNWVKGTFWLRGGQCSDLCSQYLYFMYLQKRKVFFLITLHKSWESLVALQLPSDC